MFSKFKSTITGYKIKKVLIHGVKVETQYKGKAPSSSPVAILEELKVKLRHHPTAVPMTVGFEGCWNGRLEVLKGIRASSISKFNISGKQFKISRFVTKQNKSPLSLYTLSADDKIFGLFSRLYDYGSDFRKIEAELFSKYNLVKPSAETSLHHITDGNYSAVVDMFGHSQCFIWNHQEEFETCLAAI
ncbi:hypothetical protein [Algoriphagus sp.]|uniref:hypothetical protein n=1 Tax=Algoriphagus sp. TaxID=1872435 RepID=UPI00328AAD7F